MEILLVQLLSQNPFAGALQIEEKERARNDQYWPNRVPLLEQSPGLNCITFSLSFTQWRNLSTPHEEGLHCPASHAHHPSGQEARRWTRIGMLPEPTRWKTITGLPGDRPWSCGRLTVWTCGAVKLDSPSWSINCVCRMLPGYACAAVRTEKVTRAGAILHVNRIWCSC